jgi:hypothetical protein
LRGDSGGVGGAGGMVPLLISQAFQAITATIAISIGNHSEASGMAMRRTRSRTKPMVPSRSQAIRANKPAIRKNSSMRNMCGT